ncbi:cobalt ECF transporter T component CbiQ [soil metagenome]
MGAGHSSDLHVPGDSPLHRAPPQCKVAGAVLLVLAFVVTPREQVWAFGLHAALVLILAVVAGVPLARMARRLVIELPFVAFAFLLPFVAGGERTELGPLTLSIDGLWGAWNILAKGTLGVAVAVLLTATTPGADLVRGLGRLHLPPVLVTIVTLMARYGEVLTGEVHRMRIARLSRGYDPRWAWQARAVASSAGTLFVRSYERGERVHLAMVARGFTGTLPDDGADGAGAPWWARSLAVPAIALATSTLGWVVAA